MNCSISGVKRRKRLGYKIIIKDYKGYTLTIVFAYLSLLMIVLSQIYLWSHYEKSKELHKEWYTEVNTKFKILDKLQQRGGKYEDKLIFLLENTETKEKLILKVTPKTYMSKSKGDTAWFNVSKFDYLDGNKATPSVLPVWFIFFLVIFPLVVLFFGGCQSYTGEGSDYHYLSYHGDYSISELEVMREKYKVILDIPFIVSAASIVSSIVYFIMIQ